MADDHLTGRFLGIAGDVVRRVGGRLRFQAVRSDDAHQQSARVSRKARKSYSLQAMMRVEIVSQRTSDVIWPRSRHPGDSHAKLVVFRSNRADARPISKHPL